MSDDMLEMAVRSLTDPSALMDRIVVAALELIPSADGSVVELAHDEFMEYAHTGGTLAPFTGLRLQAKNSLSGLSVEMGTTLYCADAETDPRVDREACRRVGARSLVCVPLRSGGEPVGVLKVTAPVARAFGVKDVETLAGLSSFVTAAITTADSLGASAGRALHRADGTRIAGAHAEAVSGFMASILRPDVAEDLQASRRIQQALDERSFTIVHQPIFDLESGEPVISEALSRFSAEPARPPDAWFHEAWRVGLGAALEMATASAALEDLGRLPEGCRLAINCSPSLLEHPDAQVMETWPAPERLVVEITEHVDMEDFEQSQRFLDPLRAKGLMVAMDDAGNGYSNLRRLIDLAPDIIKIDYGLVHHIDLDPVRQSLVTALVGLAGDLQAMIVAEGIETPGELGTLQELGVRYGQGFLLARPGPVDLVGPMAQFALGPATRL